jgi:DNA repair exonuclease SbcCD ATPase subunit
VKEATTTTPDTSYRLLEETNKALEAEIDKLRHTPQISSSEDLSELARLKSELKQLEETNLSTAHELESAIEEERAGFAAAKSAQEQRELALQRALSQAQEALQAATAQCKQDFFSSI